MLDEKFIKYEDIDFINTNLNLPDHSNELSKADEVLEKIKNRFNIIKKNQTIDDKNHVIMYEEIVRVLDYLGALSMSAFKIETQLEELYTKQYSHAPQLAKKMWFDHYELIHHPYNLLKNRCFRMLDELDNEFIKIHKMNPKNWNI